MKRTLIGIAALACAASSNAQLWDGSPLPMTLPGSAVDSYFADGGSLSEFDNDTGTEFSLQQYGTKPANIDLAHGWVDPSSFAVSLEDGDQVFVTYLGKTAGWLNDFGVNIGGKNAFGEDYVNPDPYDGTPFTLWSSIDNGTPAVGDQFHFNFLGAETPIDFWFNSNQSDHGGTYSMFFPETSVPTNSGLPEFDFSALGKVFNVNDSFSGLNRSILVIAIEDWRDFDADFTDMFFAIEIYDRDGNSQFPVPEPSTYGLIGAMLLLGLAAIRRIRAG